MAESRGGLLFTPSTLRVPLPKGAEYSPPSGPAKRGCVLWVIIGGVARSDGEGISIRRPWLWVHGWSYRQDDATKRIRVFCPPPHKPWATGGHPEGVFYTFATGKERKNDRQDPVHLCVGTADGFVVIPPKGGIQFCVPQNLRNNADDSAPIGPRRGATCDGWVMPGEGNPQGGGGKTKTLSVATRHPSDNHPQNASAFCHPEGVFTPLPPAKNVKTTVRIQSIYVSATRRRLCRHTAEGRYPVDTQYQLA